MMKPIIEQVATLTQCAKIWAVPLDAVIFWNMIEMSYRQNHFPIKFSGREQMNFRASGSSAIFVTAPAFSEAFASRTQLLGKRPS